MPSKNTSIEWCESTWNFIHGCAKVSEGCLHCYAARISFEQYGHTDEKWTQEHLEENFRTQPQYLDFPHSLDDPQRVFINSMSDLFLPRELLPAEYIHEVFDVIEQHPEHAFIALTKHGAETSQPDDDGIHPETPRLLQWEREHGRWPENLWMGVSIESDRRTYRADVLRQTSASTKWISFEPLVEPVHHPNQVTAGMDWLVVGGESGPEDDRRRMDHAWARRIYHAAASRDIPYYFKQSSGPRQGHQPVLALVGATPSHARLQRGADGILEIRGLPELPSELREARPELAEWEGVTPTQEVDGDGE